MAFLQEREKRLFLVFQYDIIRHTLGQPCFLDLKQQTLHRRADCIRELSY
jgi:hypothetical protein